MNFTSAHSCFPSGVQVEKYSSPGKPNHRVAQKRKKGKKGENKKRSALGAPILI